MYSAISGRPRLALKASAFLLSLSLFGCSFAYSGFTVGFFGGPPTSGPYVVSVRLVQPLAEVAANGTPVQISVRGDIATALTFRSLPAVGLAVVGGSTVEGVERYLGAGIGAGFVGRSPLWSAYGLAGFRMPILEGLAGAFELQLSTNRFTTGPRLGVALEYSFGADR